MSTSRKCSIFVIFFLLFSIYMSITLYYYAANLIILPTTIFAGNSEVPRNDIVQVNNVQEKPNIITEISLPTLFTSNSSTINVNAHSEISKVHVSLKSNSTDLHLQGNKGEKSSHKKLNNASVNTNSTNERFLLQAKQAAHLWPEDERNVSRRVASQYNILSDIFKDKKNLDSVLPMKTILSWHGYSVFPITSSGLRGQTLFYNEKCPTKMCRITFNRSEINSADLVFFTDVAKGVQRTKYDQIWMFHSMESPDYHLQFSVKANWTASYNRLSDIPHVYGFVQYSSARATIPLKNYVRNKMKKVAWVVSNCRAKNNRLEYAQELSKYINIDIYGRCGSLKCPKNRTYNCLRKIEQKYKFYLAFENTNCREYITEKFWVSSLGGGMVPIVMGAHPEDYKLAAPEHSYIHVDHFDSPKQLAEYLHKLDKNDTLYSEYFRWNMKYEVVLKDSFFCRLCNMLHLPLKHREFEPDSSPVFNKKCCIESRKWTEEDLETCKI